VILGVENLGLSLGGREILKSLNFSLEQGEFLCVIGPNGAGKSSLLKCLCGIYGDYRGRIELQGEELRRLDSRESARQVSYVPQFLEGEVPFSVEEFIYLSRYPWSGGVFEKSQACERAQEICAVNPLAKQSMNSLSGGERQRVLVAAALAQESPILLLDEVTASLDPKHHHSICALLEKINREQDKTVIWVTHDLNSAVQSAHRVLALKEGEVYFDGPAAKALTKLDGLYDHQFTILENPQGGTPLIF
jgi:iron complex transport system ATP-binding protein